MSRGAPKTPSWWFNDGPVPLPARLLATVYAAAIALRGRLYRIGLLRRHSVPVPVVVVGNLAAGGAGKTPLTLALVERLRREGWRPGVASRGYGRADTAPRWVLPETPVEQGGDEPVLIARRAAVPVRVDRDRAAAARALVEAGCDVVVCDDGLQHYRLERDVEIEVIDGARRYGNGRMLPAGPLREPAERGRRCDFRVVNLGHGGAAASAPGTGRAAERPAACATGFGEWPMYLRTRSVLPLAGGRPRPLAAFAGLRVHAVAGIGNPERFFDTLRAAGIGVVPHAFADHHAYQPADLEFGNDLPVLMTEKDAVKCAAFADERCHAVPVDAELPAAFWVALLDRLGSPPREG
ncbi:tetraacyldisaccharide 4'-kinase [Pseudoxanthomonas sp. SGD-10]|uniref:tetraacyldisaccharide 4'-kinase n=2 Tax=unclassified Pseudoxanthomonas TaxID=2645906 RepID=UPI0004217558|nr:tetraacyldisaccharide 4'-kinase [Pseudoxanthomonas sp. J31]RRN78378.1 tetraacyldisaccharide 4'-kinase [Pseudoxanthomonas sp. SGD-10]